MLVSCKRNEARRAINDHLLFYSPLNVNYVPLFFFCCSPQSRPATGLRVIIRDSIRRVPFHFKDKCVSWKSERPSE